MNLSVCIFRLLFKKLIKFSGTFSNINTFVTLPADLSRHETVFGHLFLLRTLFETETLEQVVSSPRDESVKNADDDSCIDKVKSTENIC